MMRRYVAWRIHLAGGDSVLVEGLQPEMHTRDKRRVVIWYDDGNIHLTMHADVVQIVKEGDRP